MQGSVEWRDKMTEQEFVTKATDLTKQIVDILADKEYAKLASPCTDRFFMGRRRADTGRGVCIIWGMA